MFTGPVFDLLPACAGPRVTYAAGLAPFAPDAAAVQAGRLMLQELTRHCTARESFAFETTLSGRSCLHHIRAWQAAGYRVKLIFLQLDSAGTTPVLLDWSQKP